MKKIIDNILKPNLYIKKESNKSFYIILNPLERGFGNTIGNSLRRILLSYIPGSAITEVEINNVLHEYEGKSGLKEDILDILLNIKDLSISLKNKEYELITINKSEVGNVTSKDIKVTNFVKILDDDYHICTITNKNINLNIKMKVENGIGYSKFIINNYSDKSIGKLYLDCNFNPIKKVSYNIENTRIKNMSNLDKLVMYIETNGLVDPEYVIKTASNILIDQFVNLLEFNKDKDNIKNNIDLNNNNINNNNILSKSIDELELTIRSYNCLKSESIYYIKDLINKSESELLKIPNLGKKSLLEIKSIIKNFNLTLNTKLNNNK